MALGEAVEVAGVHVFNASLVDDAVGNVAGGDKVSQPLDDIWIVFVEVDSHSHKP